MWGGGGREAYPGGSKAEDEEGGEDDHCSAGFLRSLRMDPVKAEMTDGREDQETDEHPGRAGDERLAAPIVLHDVELEAFELVEILLCVERKLKKLWILNELTP